MTQIKVCPYHIKLLLCNIDSIFTVTSPLKGERLNVCCAQLCRSKGQCVCLFFNGLRVLFFHSFSLVLCKQHQSTAGVKCRKFPKNYVPGSLYSTIKRLSIYDCNKCDDDFIYMDTMSIKSSYILSVKFCGGFEAAVNGIGWLLLRQHHFTAHPRLECR